MISDKAERPHAERVASLRAFHLLPYLPRESIAPEPAKSSKSSLQPCGGGPMAGMMVRSWFFDAIGTSDEEAGRTRFLRSRDPNPPVFPRSPFRVHWVRPGVSNCPWREILGTLSLIQVDLPAIGKSMGLDPLPGVKAALTNRADAAGRERQLARKNTAAFGHRLALQKLGLVLAFLAVWGPAQVTMGVDRTVQDGILSLRGIPCRAGTVAQLKG